MWYLVSIDTSFIMHTHTSNFFVLLPKNRGPFITGLLYLVINTHTLTISVSCPLDSGSSGFSSVNCWSFMPAILESNLQSPWQHTHLRLTRLFDSKPKSNQIRLVLQYWNITYTAQTLYRVPAGKKKSDHINLKTQWYQNYSSSLYQNCSFVAFTPCLLALRSSILQSTIKVD